MTTLIFSTGGCPSYPFYSFKRGPWYPVFRENTSREVATKDHFSSNPPKGNPPDLKTKVDVSKVDVKGFPSKVSALVNVQMALGQTAGCPRVNRAKKFMCSPRNTGNINFSLWLTGGLSQGCPDFQKVYVFKGYMCLFLALLPQRRKNHYASRVFPENIPENWPKIQAAKNSYFCCKVC